MGRDMFMQIGKGLGTIFQETRIAYLRIKPVIGDGDHDAFAGEGLAERQIHILAAALPGPAIEEEDHRRPGVEMIRNIKVQRLARVIAISQSALDVITGARHGKVEQRHGRAGGQHAEQRQYGRAAPDGFHGRASPMGLWGWRRTPFNIKRTASK